MESARRWLDQIQGWVQEASFEPSTEIRLMVEGDVSEPRSFSGRLSVQSRGGRMTNIVWKELILTAQWNVKDPASGAPSNHLDLQLGSVGGAVLAAGVVACALAKNIPLATKANAINNFFI